MIRFAHLMIVVGLLAAIEGASAKPDECMGLAAITRSPPKSISKEVLEVVTKIFSGVIYKDAEQKEGLCDSLGNVLRTVSSGSQNGGKGSEEKRAPNPQQSAMALATALEDPEIAGQLQMRGETLLLVGYEAENQDAQLIYAAALLNSHEKYLARDLLIQQLQKKLR